MSKTKKEIIEEIKEELENLSELFTERIYENNTVGKGMMTKQATHAFLLYRRELSNIEKLVDKL